MAALASQGAGMPPLWPLLAHPAGQPFRAGVSTPGQSQGGRWAGSLGLARGRDRGGQGCVGEGRPGKGSCPSMEWLCFPTGRKFWVLQLSSIILLGSVYLSAGQAPGTWGGGDIFGNAAWELIGQDLRPTTRLPGLHGH